LTQLSSFSPDTGFDTGTTGPKVAENPTNDKGPDDQTTPLPAEPQDAAGPSDETVPAHPLPPASLLQPQPGPSSKFFTLGSTTSEVLDVQGAPTRVQGQTWSYGLSEVQFKNGLVWKFNNFDGSLRVRMLPGASEAGALSEYISIGSPEDAVLLVQGTPTRVEGERWFYGFSEIVFKNGRIAEYDNYFGNLKIRLLPSGPADHKAPGNFFTLGSTPDQVLAVQGTPTSIHGNRWSFGFSAVSFRDGKVHDVTDTEGNLRFIAPERAGENEGQ
jgi:hypothetical protein